MDVTGVVLTPGNGGRNCLGNGEHPGIECCCDECDYMQCCLDNKDDKRCIGCKDEDCPRRIQRMYREIATSRCSSQ